MAEQDVAHDVINALKQALSPFEELARKKGLFIQVGRVFGDTTISTVAVPDVRQNVLDGLNRKMQQFIQTNRAQVGCATAIVPDGPDVYVVTAGALSDGALTLLAQEVAKQAARMSVGAQLA